MLTSAPSTAKAIDSYVAARETPASATDVVPVDSRLEAIVERMFERCERDGEYKQVSRHFDALQSSRADALWLPVAWNRSLVASLGRD